MIKTNVINAEKFSQWIKERGGIAQWDAIDFSDDSCFTPACTDVSRNVSTPKPHWKYPNIPQSIITDSSMVILYTQKEVKRFHIAVRIGAQGFRVKCTDASTRKIHAALEKFGKDSWYEFDYSTQEAVFYLPDSSITLKQWEEQHDQKAA